VLVNNAAILAPQSRLEDLGFERMSRIVLVNAIGPILCIQQAVKRISFRYSGRGGAVINISSASARLGSPNEYVDYAASKGAVETFTTGFAKEVARDGIRVNCVRPGHIYTDMHARGGEPGRVDRVKDSIPMGRGGQPEEVARAILWLASAEASFITGTFLDVTGGK
jgi:NAD(P)-dependent dehydrogenase (short-subunit alcohol dehydrogenase family)